MADQERRVSIVAWPEQAAKLEHTFCSDEPCSVTVSFADTPANVTISSSPQQPVHVDMNMQVAARRPIPVCISVCEPICARSDYTVGIQIFGNPFATIDVRGMTRLFQCRDKPVCVDFQDFQAGMEFAQPFTHQGLGFRPLGAPLRTVAFGDPAGSVKLGLPRSGVRIEFPQPVKDVRLTVNNYAGPTLDFAAFAGSTLLVRFSENISNEVKEVSIAQSGITAVEITGGNNEAGLIQVCYTPIEPA